LKLLEDRDGDGKVDHSTVFAEGFNQILDGLGAGVLARNGNVWFTCIPDLWLLRDTNGDGVADFRKSLQRGYGVRIGSWATICTACDLVRTGNFISLWVTAARMYTPKGTWLARRTPAVSCAVIRTVRNSSIRVRLAQSAGTGPLTNTAISGQATTTPIAAIRRAGFISSKAGIAAGGWVTSSWKSRTRAVRSCREALVSPVRRAGCIHCSPIANISSGPSGVTYNPGTGLPEKYAEHFFLADFHGDAGSCVHSLGRKAQGASFELVDASLLVKGLLATDV